MGRRQRGAAAAFVAAGVMWLGLMLGGAPGVASAGTPVPGAPNCPMFPADNVWNTAHRQPAGRPAQRGQWLASMNSATTNLHPDFGPSGDPVQPLRHALHRGAPRRIPWCPSRSSTPDESDPGPYPFGADTPIEGGQQATRRPPRHHGQPGHVHPLRALRRALQPVGLDRRLGGDLEPRLRRPAPRRMDVGRRGRPADPARAPALRRGAVGCRHPRHPDDRRGDGHLVPVAGPPRGRDRRPTRTSRRWGHGSGSRPTSTSRATRPRRRWSCAPCSSTG